MSLLRRVTRYRISPTQDTRENRLTEVTAAVLGRVDGLAHDVMDMALATAARRCLYVTVAVDGHPARRALRRRPAGRQPAAAFFELRIAGDEIRALVVRR